ncbi:MAG: hypothetical protein ABW161_01155 [Candidatus Thiodiazotropha sp.]
MDVIFLKRVVGVALVGFLLIGPAWSEERSSLPDEAAVYDCALSWVAEKGFIQSDPEATFEDLKASQTFAGCKESEASSLPRSEVKNIIENAWVAG